MRTLGKFGRLAGALGILLLSHGAQGQNVTGTGTVNFIPRFTAASAVGNSALFQSGSSIGLGTTAPGRRFHVQTGVSNDGIRISQITTAALELTNTTVGGRNWALFSTGTGNAQGAGNFSIFEYPSNLDRLFIQGTTGNIGIGTIAPVAKLHLVGTMPANVSGGAYTPKSMLKVEYTASVNAFLNNQSHGIESILNLRSDNGTNVGANAAVKGSVDWSCVTPGGNIGAGSVVTGVWGEITGGYDGFGVYGRFSAQCTGSQAYAGYFDGRVYTTQTYNSSDRKLKQDIKPLNASLDLLMRLKPMEYSFRVEEFKHMNLPSGRHMGFIAQELEEVLPELVASSSSPILGENGNEQGRTKFNAVNYTEIIPLLTAAMQEQQSTIQALENRINSQDLLLQHLSSGRPEAKNGRVEMLISPNPTNDRAMVSIYLVDEVKSGSLVVVDESGKEVVRESVFGSGLKSLELSTGALGNGIYMCQFLVNGEVLAIQKLVVGH
jgi:Chaperone of endosialidase